MRKISVIVPTYNCANIIKNTILSIIQQSIGFENIELILVDDNSTDGTSEIIKEFEDQYKNIKCIFLKENSGSAAIPRNVGIEKASADYIMFLDNDDRYDLKICETLYNAINENDANIVMCNYKIIYNNQFPNEKNIIQDASFLKVDPKKNETILNDIYMWNKIFKRKFIYDHDIKCPQSLSEDMAFVIKSYLNTDEIIFLNNYYGYFYNVRDSENNKSTINSITESKYASMLEGYYSTINLFKEYGREDLINLFMKNHFITLISLFIKLNSDDYTKKRILEELYSFKQYSNFYHPLSEKWAEFFNKKIEKRDFGVILFFSKIINKLYKLKALKKFYRQIYRKK